MTLLRKIKTAFRVLGSYGPKEALGLLGDNLREACLQTAAFFTRLVRIIAFTLFPGLFRRGKKLNVLYVTTKFEEKHSQTARYRIFNFRAALKGRANTLFETVKHVSPAFIRWADIVILMRVTYTPEAQRIADTAKSLGVPVVFDIDDIIFSLDYVPDYCRVLGDTSEENFKKRSGEFEGFAKTFALCGYSTASTHYIKEIMEKAGKTAYVIHNGLNAKQLAIAARSRRAAGAPRAIGYLSGTKTHDRDFLAALPALERIFAEYPDVRMNIAGYLELSELPEAIAARTTHACYMSWQRLMSYGAQNYINIAPLNVSNRFCHAKSELKFFEAAAVGVPTVASPTDTFSRCITHGVNGMLASDEQGWYDSIKALLDDSGLYAGVSRAAREYALAHYSPGAIADEALAAYGAIIADNKKQKG
jgi:glycosyltransferase involved in cell wall biosynthesis